MVSVRSLFLLHVLCGVVLAIVYFIPRSIYIPLFDGNETVLFYHGMGFHSGAGYFGRNPYRIRVTDREFGGTFDVRYSKGHGDYYFYRGYYESGILREEGQCRVVDFRGLVWPNRLDIQSGRFYDVAGNLVSSVTNGHGIQKIFWKNGQLALEQNFVEKKVTYVKRWHDNGQLSEDAPHLAGRPQGLHSIYFANGQLRAEGQYENGHQVGLWRYYMEDGSADGTVNYDGP